MFRSTYLGWQSWLFTEGDSALLVDPLLVDEIGRGFAPAQVNFMFNPPRRFDFAHLPRINGVFISHEHEDHFNIPSLSRLDRQIPIYISSRSSRAATTLLDEMGFKVHRVSEGERHRFGDLSLRTFAADFHPSEADNDEWDTLAYLVTSDRGNGHFFTNVDIGVTPKMTAALEALAAEPSGADLVIFHGMQLQRWGPGGLRELEGHEMHGKPKADARIAEPAERLAQWRAGEKLSLQAGESIELDGGKAVELGNRCPFLERDDRPERQAEIKPFFTPKGTIDFPPACGKFDLPDGEIEELESHLDDLATHLYGGTLFRALLAVDRSTLGAVRPQLLLVLLTDNDGGALAYELDSTSARFESAEVEDDFHQRNAMVVCCWATDLLGVMRSEFEPRIMSRAWFETSPIILPARVSFLRNVLWTYFHPLRFPERSLAQYRRKLAQQSATAVQVWAKGSAPTVSP